jgi:Methylamine utilisation protein MauE
LRALGEVPIDWSVAAQARLALSAVFLLSAAGKLVPGIGRAGLRTAVESFGRVPPRWSGRVAVLVVGVECAVAVALWWGVTGRWALLGAAAILLLFALVLWHGVRRGVAVPCACFGSSRSPAGTAEVWRNLVLAAIAVAGAAGYTASAPLLGGPAAAVVDRLLIAAAVSVAAAGFTDYAQLFTGRGTT